MSARRKRPVTDPWPEITAQIMSEIEAWEADRKAARGRCPDCPAGYDCGKVLGHPWARGEAEVRGTEVLAKSAPPRWVDNPDLAPGNRFHILNQAGSYLTHLVNGREVITEYRAREVDSQGVRYWDHRDGRMAWISLDAVERVVWEEREEYSWREPDSYVSRLLDYRLAEAAALREALRYGAGKALNERRKAAGGGDAS